MSMSATDRLLLEAARKRALRAFEQEQERQAVINNIIGGQGGLGYQPTQKGITEQMAGEEPFDPGMYDYLVDITREDLPEINPETGKPKGWKKTVRRYREERGGGGKKKDRMGK